MMYVSYCDTIYKSRPFPFGDGNRERPARMLVASAGRWDAWIGREDDEEPPFPLYFYMHLNVHPGHLRRLQPGDQPAKPSEGPLRCLAERDPLLFEII